MSRFKCNTGHTHNKTAGSHDRRHPPNERRQGKPWRLLSILHGGSSKAVCSSGSDHGSVFQLCSPCLSMRQTPADILFKMLKREAQLLYT